MPARLRRIDYTGARTHGARVVPILKIQKEAPLRLTMLGTGNAVVTRYYNTCFVLSEGGRHLLVDGGGGNALLGRLREAGIDWREVREVFVTHRHIDHLLGIVWLVRMVTQAMERGDLEGEVTLVSHAEVLDLLRRMAHDLLAPADAAHVDERLRLVEVDDGDVLDLIGHRTTFFDIGSTKATQFGFVMELGEGRRLTCCGDEPCPPCAEDHVRGSAWLLHEAFCLWEDRDAFRPHEKHHSTVREACELAERLGVENVVLYHTEDATFPDRRRRYTEEGRRYFTGGIWVPDDLDAIEL